jgi:hypothetical protein
MVFIQDQISYLGLSAIHKVSKEVNSILDFIYIPAYKKQRDK